MTSSARPSRAAALTPLLSPVALVLLMWAIQLFDAALSGSFTGYGLRSWDLGSVGGLVLGPLLHSGWVHLIANTLPMLLLGGLVAIEGVARFWMVTVVAALVGGIGTWLFNAPGTLTVGASVLVFGYFAYIVVRVFSPRPIEHRIAYALIALIVVVLYGGSMLTGILGAGPGVSWQAHLFGAVGGGMAGLVGARRGRSMRDDRTA